VVIINLFNLVARLSLDSDEYNEKIEQAKKKGEELAESTKKKHAMAMVAGWTAVAVAVGAVIKKIADLAMATMNYADQVGDLAEQWGFTTKEIQEFDYWATQNGTTLESLLTGMRGLVNQAEAGSGAFEKLGVSVKNADGTFKDQRTLFLETMTALQGIEDTVQRNALQFEIFGRAGISLGQVINKSGAELEALSQKAEDYGLIISEKAIKASSDFNDELDTLKRQFKSAIAELVAGDPEEGYRKFEEFATQLVDKMAQVIPKFILFAIRLSNSIIRELIKNLPSMIGQLIQEVFKINWFEVGVQIGKEILIGIVKTIGAVIGYGWLWGGENNNNAQVEAVTTSNAYSTVTSANVSEKTTKVDEKLDITLSVESDGTVAGQQNLDIITDMMTDKINKALGDLVNG